MPPASTKLYLSFAAKVTDQTASSLMHTLAAAIQQGVQELNLLLATPGGSVMHGMALYNYLTALPVALTTFNIGNVDSIGAIVFLAGTHRFACPHSTFTLHPVATGFPAGHNFEQPDVSAIAQTLEADQARIAAIYALRAGLSNGKASGLFNQQKTYSAAEAKAFGFVHKVKPLVIERGALVVHLNVS